MSYDSPAVEAFLTAVFRGKKKEVKALLSAGVVNGRRSDGITALHLVASTGSARICKLLLASGATVDAREQHGATPLNLASQNGHVGVCRLLIEAGADVNARRVDGVAPLFMAAQEGHAKVVQLLIESKADIAQTRPGSDATALFIAAQKGRAKVVELLVAAGSPLNGSLECVTPLEAAIAGNHMRCAQVLIAAGAKVAIGPPAQRDKESEALKWLGKARKLLAEIEDQPTDEVGAPGEEGRNLLQPKLVSTKKKGILGLSKRDAVEKHTECLKVIAKADTKLQRVRKALAKEREQAQREVANWKMAYMMATGGFVLPAEPEEAVAEQEEVGAPLKEDV